MPRQAILTHTHDARLPNPNTQAVKVPYTESGMYARGHVYPAGSPFYVKPNPFRHIGDVALVAGGRVMDESLCQKIFESAAPIYPYYTDMDLSICSAAERAGWIGIYCALGDGLLINRCITNRDPDLVRHL